MDKDIIEVLRNTKNFFSGKPATLEQVEQAQKELGLKFAEDYIKYLLEFGTVSFYGTELMGIEEPEYKCEGVVCQTLEEKSFDCHSQVPDNMYVIENVGIDGLLAWQDESGTVYLTLPWQEPQKYADSLAEYIEMVIAEDTAAYEKYGF